MQDDRKNSDEWALRDALLVTAGFTLAVVFLTHVVVKLADLIRL